MVRDPRYDILFEPVKIGPKVARNRFYQVPHCNGMGRTYPSSLAEMRGVKAEGGWAVVCTEEVELHYTSDVSPSNEGRLWSDQDMPAHQRMVEKVQAHGSLAGIEIMHQGSHAFNRYSREPVLGPSHRPSVYTDPIHTRAMDKQDIKNMRKWYRDAALRAKACGYDLIYVYCGHNLTILTDFLSRRLNDRTDEYGGSLENRVRLFREILQDTLEAVGDTCAVPIRFAVDELMGPDGLSCENEGRDVVEMLAEMPDLWDVNVASWENDSQTSRFSEEGFQEPFINFVKKITTKPVVGVGRYTSPDRMVKLIKDGVMDMIGAARPSIADPFLPKKIEEGRIEDIRECIGCNICVTGDHLSVPMRCTQNPTVGEEWRRGWHPEKFAPKTSEDSILVVGGGPSGLEAARVLGERGYSVVLAEALDTLGGRVEREKKLPGLSAWGRVGDYRTGQIQPMVNVETYLSSALDADAVMEFGATHVAIATGSKWRRDGIGANNHFTVPGTDGTNIFTPDDVMDGVDIKGPVLIYDDDGFYMGGVIAEKLSKNGADVTLMTPEGDVSSFTLNSLEQHIIQSGLMKMGVTIITKHLLKEIDGSSVKSSCIYTDAISDYEFASVILVTGQYPQNDLYYALKDRFDEWDAAGIKSVKMIGDAESPGIIASAVWSGHRYARDMGEPEFDPDFDGVPFKRELTELSNE